MALPMSGCNLVGTLVLASSSSTGSGNVGPTNDLGIAIGTSISNGASVTSALIPVPGRAMHCLLLAQLASGTATINLDTTSDGTAPAFSGGNNVSQQVLRGEPIFLEVNTADATQTDVNGVITTTGKQNIVACKITNQAGASLTVSKLRLLTSIIIDPNFNDWFTVKTAYHVCAPTNTGQYTPLDTSTGSWNSST